MGMYTELFLTVELKKDMPEEELTWLENACSGVGYATDWLDIFNSGSAYFAGIPFSKLDRHYYQDTHLTVLCNYKNYNNEIETFLDWVKPFVKPRGYAGYIRYEENDYPTLIFFERGTGEMRMVDAYDVYERI